MKCWQNVEHLQLSPTTDGHLATITSLDTFLSASVEAKHMCTLSTWNFTPRIILIKNAYVQSLNSYK